MPLAAILTGANVNGVTQLLPLIDAIPSIHELHTYQSADCVWSMPMRLRRRATSTNVAQVQYDDREVPHRIR